MYCHKFQAPKSDHFTSTFLWHETMGDIMSTMCTDSFSNLPHWALQLQYFEIMVRYEHYFATAPQNLFPTMVSFLYCHCLCMIDL